MTTELSGVFAPIVTPFRLADGEVDHPWLAEHIAYLKAQGCDGLVACGTNGEAASLSVAERQAVLETALKHAGPMPVLAGTGAAALPDAIALTRHAFAAGAAGVLVVPPFFFKRPADAGIAAWFRRLIDAAVPPDGRVLLYHIPQATAVPFGDELLAALLSSHGSTIYGIKDSTGDPDQGQHIRANFPGLAYFCGNDHLIGAACADGGAGSISAAANVFPDVVKAAQRAAHGAAHGAAHRAARGDGTASDLAAAQATLDAVRSTFERYPLQPATKAALSDVAGLPQTAVRPPQVELSMAQRAELRAILAEKLPQWRVTGTNQTLVTM